MTCSIGRCRAIRQSPGWQRDLLDEDRPELRARIPAEGWAAALLGPRSPDAHWGRGFYFPKWTSTHYTLLDLVNLAGPPVPDIRASVDAVLDEVNEGRSGGKTVYTDTCINGMLLCYASQFEADAAELVPIVDFLLADTMPDGGFKANACARAHITRLCPRPFRCLRVSRPTARRGMTPVRCKSMP